MSDGGQPRLMRLFPNPGMLLAGIPYRLLSGSRAGNGFRTWPWRLLPVSVWPLVPCILHVAFIRLVAQPRWWLWFVQINCISWALPASTNPSCLLLLRLTGYSSGDGIQPTCISRKKLLYQRRRNMNRSTTKISCMPWVTLIPLSMSPKRTCWKSTNWQQSDMLTHPKIEPYWYIWIPG